MDSIKSGTTYRCVNEKCKAQVQARNDCGCQDDCGPICCGQKMVKM